MNASKIIERIVSFAVAIILLQTLFFKFTGAEESKFIFTQLGMEPAGRIGIGVLELITAILLFMPKWNHLGALLGLGIISGAIFFHLTKLGIEVQGDGGALFYLAVAVFVGCLILLVMKKDALIDTVKKLTGKSV